MITSVSKWPGAEGRRKAIFVTGGGSGIGQAIAVFFASRGWLVGLGDIDPVGLGRTAQLIDPDLAFTFELDVRDRSGWNSALEAFARHTNGRIDVVANNAGIGVGGTLVELSEMDVDRVIGVNLRGVVNGARASHGYLKAAGPGSCLLNTASASAIYGTAGLALYSATKFAVRGLTEALDLEWEMDCIRCRSIMPAFVDTPMMAQPSEPHGSQSKRDRVIAANLELLSPEDVAQAAWRAIHGSRIHVLVGNSARRMQFGARWSPSLLRKVMRRLLQAQRTRL